jgi:hypothetical protein
LCELREATILKKASNRWAFQKGSFVQQRQNPVSPVLVTEFHSVFTLELVFTDQTRRFKEIMLRQEFSSSVKQSAIARQKGKCAWCGISIRTPWTAGSCDGNAHHLVPDLHGGWPDVDNCVYLCWADHQLIGHGNAPFGIDNQGGSSRTRVFLAKSQFRNWNG